MKSIRKRPDKAYLGLDLWVPKEGLNVEGVKNALRFPYTVGQGEVRTLELFREATNHIMVPREFWRYDEHFNFEVVDLRPRTYKKVGFKSRIKLDHEFKGGKLYPTGQTYQQEALESLLRARGGTLELACGKGKTIIALQFIASRNVPALILVDNTQLLEQWQKSIQANLDIPGGIGIIQGDKFDWKKGLVIGTYQTVAKRVSEKKWTDQIARWFGTLVGDEGHHINAPTFSLASNCTYGYRLILSATPYREDGLHVIAHFHMGSTVYRDLKQELKPEIYFYWTGFRLDMNDPATVAGTHTIGGKLSISKLAVWFGRCRTRLDFILGRVRERVKEGRKVLVLSNSVDELVNLLAVWNGAPDLYSSVPYPEPIDVGEEIPGEKLDTEELERIQKRYQEVLNVLNAKHLGEVKKKTTLQEKDDIELVLKMHEVGCKIEKLWNERQTEYRKQLLAMPSDAGLMIRKVDVKDRMRMLREKQVTFAIMKYGKEGLDEPTIDTVIACEPMSSRNTLQQVMGRALRKEEKKKAPIFEVMEDDIGPMIGMCKKMRGHLRHWSVDDGGPFTYTFVGYPESSRKIR